MMNEPPKIEEVDSEYIKDAMADGSIKRCPYCDFPTEKTAGCNYMTCICRSNGAGEWCWQCLKPKYRVFDKRPDAGFCDDKLHNSH